MRAEKFQKTTALMWAAAEGHLDVVDLLLEAGADPNRQGHITSLTERHNADHPTGGFTALMFAARNGDEAMVRRLVARGANINLKNGDDASAAMIAIYNDRFDVAATLIELGSDVNDGSLYVAVEMRDATTDQFAFDGSRRRPDNPNTQTALDLMRMLLERGADPNKTFAGSVPLDVDAQHRPLRQHAVLPRGGRGRRRGAEGADRARGRSRADAAASQRTPAADARRRRRRRARPRQSQRRPHGGDGDDDRRARAGDDGRARLHPRRRRAVSASRAAASPKTRSRCCSTAGANPNAKGPDGSDAAAPGRADAGNLEMIRALAAAKVDFTQKNNDGFTALDVAEGKQPRRGRGRPRGRPASGRCRGGRGGRAASRTSRSCCAS